MNIIKLIATVLITIIIMLATSLLYEINFIASWWPRWLCVIILMLLELLLGLVVAWQLIITITNQQNTK